LNSVDNEVLLNLTRQIVGLKKIEQVFFYTTESE